MKTKTFLNIKCNDRHHVSLMKIEGISKERANATIKTTESPLNQRNPYMHTSNQFAEKLLKRVRTFL